MALVELLVRATDAFESQGIEFFVIGGLEVSTWMEPRSGNIPD